jgi:hypothetical protein
MEAGASGSILVADLCDYSQPWIIVTIGNIMIINCNMATCAAILRVVQVWTVLNSASTGTSECYAY